MKVDNFVSNRLKNYIWYISVTTRPPQVCIPGYAPASFSYCAVTFSTHKCFNCLQSCLKYELKICTVGFIILDELRSGLLNFYALLHEV